MIGSPRHHTSQPLIIIYRVIIFPRVTGTALPPHMLTLILPLLPNNRLAISCSPFDPLSSKKLIFTISSQRITTLRDNTNTIPNLLPDPASGVNPVPENLAPAVTTTTLRTCSAKGAIQIGQIGMACVFRAQRPDTTTLAQRCTSRHLEFSLSLSTRP